MSPLSMRSSILLSLLAAGLLASGTGCAASDEASSDADVVGTSKGALSEVSGQVDTKAFPLDNPAVVAQCADGKTVIAPIAANGSFKLGLQANAEYRLLLANAVGPASFYAISHIQWHHAAGFSEWAELGASPVQLGTVKPMTEAEATSCSSCQAAASALASGSATANASASAYAEGAARAGIWGQASGGAQGYVGGSASANAHYEAKYDASASFGSSVGGAVGGFLGSIFGGGSASANGDANANVNVNVSASVSASASASIQGQWGWVGGGAWSGAWGVSSLGAGGGSASASGELSAGWHFCDELQITKRMNFSSSAVADGVKASASSSGSAELDAKLGSSCSAPGFQQAPQLPSTPIAVGGACSFNAQCGQSNFCASSKCVAGESSAVR